MHAAQRSFLLVESNVGLGDDGLQPMRCKFMLTENAREKTRESSLRSISTTNAPLSFVSVKIT
jgi:hypothetical protein